MDVCVITLIDNNNYGNRLQNYATVSFLSSIGCTVKTALWNQPEKSLNRALAEARVDTLLEYKSITAVQESNPQIIRQRRFQEFNERHIPFIEADPKNLDKLFVDSFDYFSVGSDQVWNPQFISTLGIMDTYLLSFAPPQKRICFSPSFGVELLPAGMQQTYAKELAKYRYLNVREQSGARLIKELTGRDADVLLDPTFAITPDEWKSAAEPLPGFDYEKPYVLYYCLGDEEQEIPSDARAALQREVQEKGLAEVRLNRPDFPLLYSAGPAQFLDLILHAELVVTDSFHATVFSLLFQRPFLLFDRILIKQGKPCNMSGRTTTLLNTVGLSKKLPENQKYAPEDIWDSGYAGALQTIEEERKRTESVLRRALIKRTSGVPAIELTCGKAMPAWGLGAGIVPKGDAQAAKKQRDIYCYALTHYANLLYDVSSSYGESERLLGRALRETQARENAFLCVKISNAQQRSRNIEEAVEYHLRTLGVDYLDMLLLHWPLPDHFVDNYKQMEKTLAAGQVRMLGVSNFHEHHLEELLQVASVKPVVNQVEHHPLLTQEPLRAYCEGHDIKIMAYTPFARGHDALYKSGIMNQLAKKYGKTIQQIIIRWNIQLGVIPIPRTSQSANLKQIAAAAQGFTLTDEEMRQISDLNDGIRMRYNPDKVDYTRV